MSEIRDGLVSTIIPVYNRPKMLREAVASVLAQTYRPIEIIISDDGSTDDTQSVAQEFVQAHPGEIRYVRNENRGPGPAREAGRQLARGEFIQYLDSDDLLWPRKFEVQVRALREHPECGVAYGYTRGVRSDHRADDVPCKWTGRELPTLFPGLLVDRWWCTETPLYRRALCDVVGPWSDLRCSQDWEYDARMGALGVRLVHCKEFVSDHRSHGGTRQTGSGKWLGPSERTRFMGLMLAHAKRAGITHDYPEMQHFSRWLFATARYCGAAGFHEESGRCFQWAKEAAGPKRSRRLDFRVYGTMARLLGWTFTAKLFGVPERLGKGRAGRGTMLRSYEQEGEPRIEA